MTIANFKARVAAYMNRDATLFTVGGVDNILEAMNDARRWAQQTYNFSMLGRQVFLKVAPSGTTWTTCKATPSDVGTDVKMKILQSAWNFSESGTPPVYTRTSKIDMGVQGDYQRLLPQWLGYEGELLPNRPTLYQFVYTEGTTLYYNAITQDSWIMLTGIQELPDLTSSDTTDFFTDHFTNWLLFAVCQNLNAFLKDDQRVAISAALLERAWAAVTERDAQAGVMGQWTNLD